MTYTKNRLKGKCCFKGCDRNNVVLNRGLCERCYQSAMKLVKKKLITWEEMEEKGMAKPSRLREKEPKTAIAKAIMRIVVERIE